MKNILVILCIGLILVACNDESSSEPCNSCPPVPADAQAPTVQSDETYNVIIEDNITYALGLSHNEINGAESTTVSLLMDAYIHDNDINNRPVVMLVHGGGFTSGSKESVSMTYLANYFASRGWVAFSINYRLQADKGTVPQEWVDFAPSLQPNQIAQFFSLYPAHRDAKAALRWIVANADNYDINTDYITVGGGSAGAITAIAISATEEEDYRDEISMDVDPTLATTNLGQLFRVSTILDFWGSKISMDAIEGIYGHQRFEENDPPILIAHGTEDIIVPFSNAEDLKAIYDENMIPVAYYPLEGERHSVWNATVDGQRLEELSFEFIVERQGLNVE